MKRLGTLVAAVLFSSSLLAQKDSAKTLDPVVTTANKFEQKQSTTGKVITVITKDQIEKSAGKTVAQLLNEQAGITISGALNNMGSPQSVFMRGAPSGRTLILLDGIPVNDPSMINNEFDINLLALDNVESIEICKGAQSTLYGSDAIAGVINIITIDKNTKKPFNLKASLAAGNYGTAKGNVQVYGKADKLLYSVRYAKLHTDGFSAANDKIGNQNFDKDNYNGDIVNANIQYQITPEFSVRGLSQYSRYKTGVDQSAFTDDKDFTITNKSFTTGGGFQFKNDNVLLVGNYQYSDITRNNFNDSTDKPGSLTRDNYFGKTQFAEIYANIKIFKGLSLLQGADFRHFTINQNNSGTYVYLGTRYSYTNPTLDSVASQASLYSSLLFNGLQNKLNVELGGRLNVHSRYGSNYTYTFNPSYTINEHLRAFGSIATGFKAPSLYQLFAGVNPSNPSLNAGPGNPDLKPETSTNYEVGMQAQCHKATSRLVYFHRDTKNGIDFDNVNYIYFNFYKQKVDGLEYELTIYPIEKLSVTANYTWLDIKETTQSRKNFDDTVYHYALKRPKHSINMNVGYAFIPALYVSVSGKYVGKRYDTGGYATEDVRLNDYFLLGAYAEYKFPSHVKLFINAQNLTNRKFFDVYGYNSIPFMFQGGITLNL